jgi:hypothetical protein
MAGARSAFSCLGSRRFNEPEGAVWDARTDTRYPPLKIRLPQFFFPPVAL